MDNVSSISEKQTKHRHDINRSVAARWSARLGESFCPVPNYFLANYYRLRPHGNANASGLSSTEAMVVVQLASFKWDERAPFPTVGTIAKRMGMSARTVREAVRRLEQLGYIKRELSPHGGPNRYHFNGLITALEELMDSDLAAEDAAKSKESA